jgi:glucokinase
MLMLLAADVGGTKTLLGLFTSTGERPAPVEVRAYSTAAFACFDDLLETFVGEVPSARSPAAFTLGVAGPVVGDRSRLTNVPWTIDAAVLAARLTARLVALVNDLEALAWSLHVLAPEELAVLHDVPPALDGNAALIAAGTGLGEAILHRVEGRLLPLPSEAGHADFAARTDRELQLVRLLRARYGRAEVEHVLSGPGLVNLHAFTHQGGACEMVEGVAEADMPARISQAGLAGRCQGCADALRMFVSAYGAEAGNLALRSMATSGLYIGGGIASRILPALRSGLFAEAFLAKPPMADLMARVPVKVILNHEAALLGAACHAQSLARATGSRLVRPADPQS